MVEEPAETGRCLRKRKVFRRRSFRRSRRTIRRKVRVSRRVRRFRRFTRVHRHRRTVFRHRRSAHWYRTHGFERITLHGRTRWISKLNKEQVDIHSSSQAVFSKELSSVENYAETIRVNLNQFSSADQSLVSKCLSLF